MMAKTDTARITNNRISTYLLTTNNRISTYLLTGLQTKVNSPLGIERRLLGRSRIAAAGGDTRQFCGDAIGDMG
jgi:hypothetical protein